MIAQPFTALRTRIHHWFVERIAPRDTVTLTQRNVYILPTVPGFMLGATLLVLLIASINYQLNLGYVLSFLLTGCATVGVYVCHANLHGLTMNLLAPDAQYAGEKAVFTVNLSSQRNRVRYGIGMAALDSENRKAEKHWVWTDVPAQGTARVQLAFVPPSRGWHPIPVLTAETRFPLGTFRVWTIWRPAAQVLVYPAPEANPPPLPAGEPRAGGVNTSVRTRTGEFDGVRAYQRGDPLKVVVWKKVAKSDTLVSRDAQNAHNVELWLDMAHTGLGAGAWEQALSRLCAWVQIADRRNVRYGLRLSNKEIPLNSGEAHKKACLQALALVSFT